MLLENVLKYQELVLYEKEVRFKVTCSDKQALHQFSDIESFDFLSYDLFRQVVKDLWFMEVVSIKTSVKLDHVLVHYHLRDHFYLDVLKKHMSAE